MDMTMKRKSPIQSRPNDFSHPVLKKLFEIMVQKETNLCIAVNFNTLEETVKFVDEIAGKHICILKTQCAFLQDADLKTSMKKFKELKEKHNFLLFEDIKLGESKQVAKAYYKNWYFDADLVTVRPEDGFGTFQAIREAIQECGDQVNQPRGCLSLIEKSFFGAVKHDAELFYKIAKEHGDVNVGIIAQRFLIPEQDKPYMVKLTPGVHLDKKTDGANQCWNHPSLVMGSGTDIIIVGRGIIQAPAEEREEVMLRYKNIAWSEYVRLNSSSSC